MDRLRGKVCVITGTGSGMGRAAALLFAREGARLVGCDIAIEDAEQTVREVVAAGGEMVSLQPGDISKREGADALVELALTTYGRIDCLYNNVGKAFMSWVPEMTYNSFRGTMDQELDVIFHPCMAAWPHMIAGGGGSIINVGSVSGKIAYKVLPALAHMAAKGAVIAMSKQLAMEGGPHQIRVNTISPGLVITPRTKGLADIPEWWGPMRDKLMLGRAGQPEDVVPCAVYLASDESRWVTGADFAIDGGTTAW